MFSGTLAGQRISVRTPFVARPANGRAQVIQCRSIEAGTLVYTSVESGLAHVLGQHGVCIVWPALNIIYIYNKQTNKQTIKQAIAPANKT